MKSADTLVLTRSDIRQFATCADYYEAVADGLRTFALSNAHSPAPVAIEEDGGVFHAKTANAVERAVKVGKGAWINLQK